MRLSGALAAALRAHAAQEAPREACGVLLGRGDDDDTLRIVRVTNSIPGRGEYAFDPTEQIALWQAAEDAGERIRVIYHSHPHGDARPSKVDRRMACYPGVVYLIIGGDGALGAWDIVDGEATQVPLEIDYGISSA